MDRISQVSLNTMRLLTDNQKITASNLANLNTIGFRRDVNTNIGSAYLQDPKAYEDRVFASRGDTGVDTSVSNLISTDRPLDIAITGEGFFVVNNPAGQKVLTRRGDMSVTADGKLKMGDGSIVQGGGAPLTIPPYEKSKSRRTEPFPTSRSALKAKPWCLRVALISSMFRQVMSCAVSMDICGRRTDNFRPMMPISK